MRSFEVSVTFAASEPLGASGASIRGPGGQRHIGVARGNIVAARPDRAASAQRRRLAHLAVLGVVIGVAAVGFALARPNLVLHAWPGLARAYSALGIPVNLRGFAFEHVTAQLEDVGGGRVLTVEGVLHNLG